MIVNTAYPFMGKKGPAINPNIWENGVVNYPYKLSSSNAQWVPSLNRFTINVLSTVTLTLPLKTFKKIKFSVAGSSGDSLLYIHVEHDTSTRKEFTVGNSQKTVEFNIPANYQRDDVNIVVGSSRRTIYAYSGVMTE